MLVRVKLGPANLSESAPRTDRSLEYSELYMYVKCK